MKLLAVETATEACSAALFIDGEVIERFQLAPQTHTRLILPMIDSLLAEAGLAARDLDGLAFGRGPGSFTGVRIATGVIQGLALGLELPVAPVSTLAALAQDYFDRQTDTFVFSAMDARMNEVFWGVYRKNSRGFAQLMGQESVGSAASVAFEAVHGAGVGTGWRVYREVLSARLDGWVTEYESENLPRAGAIAVLGAEYFAAGLQVPVEQAQPVYLRDKVAKKESER
ncbi:MAG: tRNA (adenosine(37)-N6)-threonylcarbamoyltransferase complex dimerization subunit type 1 TsaB [Gammaproteobacteria bacterium HGW-Gammaproteobacteria-3]|nr:MAG: tRNA (adenosine(37)-N6)-threonylcarbamoyltransferase complex dimerization subunit type 1 TsaB [Gammaproteobacteria bacterium HGW-Gammaproteobacteria-3]